MLAQATLTPASTDPTHVHEVRYLEPNTIGLARLRGENEPYINVISGRTVIAPPRAVCTAANCTA
jgi:hypothetical protein